MSVDDQNTPGVSDNGGSGAQVSDKCPWCGSAETPNSTEWTARFRCHSSQSRTSNRRQRSKLCGRYVAARDGVKLRAALARIAELEASLAAGTRELRRYVEGNGFQWCDDESTVFNVTTAIGLMGGALAVLNPKVKELEAELAALRSRQGADDDAEPLTPEYAESLGYIRIDKERPIRILRDESKFLAVLYGNYEDIFLCYVSTRGDVRRLVAALGGAEREGGE